MIGAELVVGGGGDHCGVVCGESAAGEVDFHAGVLGALFESGAELRVCGDTAGDEDAFGGELFGCGYGAVNQVADYSVLEFADQGQGLRAAEREELFELALTAG